MKILFTAFKGVHNTSFQLVNQTVANHILLTNSFQGLEKDISFVSDDCQQKQRPTKTRRSVFIIKDISKARHERRQVFRPKARNPFPYSSTRFGKFRAFQERC